MRHFIFAAGVLCAFVFVVPVVHAANVGDSCTPDDLGLSGINPCGDPNLTCDLNTSKCVAKSIPTQSQPNTSQTQSQPNTNANSNISLINPLKGGGSIESFLNGILAFAIRLGSIVIILMLIYVGFLFVKARGNSTEISKARTMLLYTIIGALILLGAQAIALGIEATVKALATGN